MQDIAVPWQVSGASRAKNQNSYIGPVTPRHPGVQKTLIFLSHLYWWPHLWKWLYDYVKAYAICAQTRSPTHAPTCLFPLLSIPKETWHISIWSLVLIFLSCSGAVSLNLFWLHSWWKIPFPLSMQIGIWRVKRHYKRGGGNVTLTSPGIKLLVSSPEHHIAGTQVNQKTTLPISTVAT